MVEQAATAGRDVPAAQRRPIKPLRWWQFIKKQRAWRQFRLGIVLKLGELQEDNAQLRADNARLHERCDDHTRAINYFARVQGDDHKPWIEALIEEHGPRRRQTLASKVAKKVDARKKAYEAAVKQQAAASGAAVAAPPNDEVVAPLAGGAVDPAPATLISA